MWKHPEWIAAFGQRLPYPWSYTSVHFQCDRCRTSHDCTTFFTNWGLRGLTHPCRHAESGAREVGPPRRTLSAQYAFQLQAALAATRRRAYKAGGAVVASPLTALAQPLQFSPAHGLRPMNSEVQMYRTFAQESAGAAAALAAGATALSLGSKLTPKERGNILDLCRKASA